LEIAGSTPKEPGLKSAGRGSPTSSAPRTGKTPDPIHWPRHLAHSLSFLMIRGYLHRVKNLLALGYKQLKILAPTGWPGYLQLGERALDSVYYEGIWLPVHHYFSGLPPASQSSSFGLRNFAPDFSTSFRISSASSTSSNAAAASFVFGRATLALAASNTRASDGRATNGST